MVKCPRPTRINTYMGGPKVLSGQSGAAIPLLWGWFSLLDFSPRNDLRAPAWAKADTYKAPIGGATRPGPPFQHVLHPAADHPSYLGFSIWIPLPASFIR